MYVGIYVHPCIYVYPRIYIHNLKTIQQPNITNLNPLKRPFACFIICTYVHEYKYIHTYISYTYTRTQTYVYI